MNNYSLKVAQALLSIKAVGFCPEKPIRFKSGILAPVYVDNRTFPFHPPEWRTVIEGFSHIITDKKLKFDVVAGIESAGIPHSAALGYILPVPSVFCRKQTKDHGTKKLIEGGEVKGKRVLLIEDLVTTGGSSIAGVTALRESGAVVNDCLVIVSYGFPEAITAFERAQVKLHSLTTFPTILEEAIAQQLITKLDQAIVLKWLSDPWAWTKHYEAKGKR